MDPDYQSYISKKLRSNLPVGFDPVWKPDGLFGFQDHLTDWSIRIGRGAILADCGLGKTVMQLTWAENIIRKETGNRTGLILTPISVSKQTVEEGAKFGIEVRNARTQGIKKNAINVTNYESLHKFNPSDFKWIVCDESGILKNFDGTRRKQITEFVQKAKYRLLCSATPAPNDFTELGSSADALGVMQRNQMLGMFFTHRSDSTQNWELKGHSRKAFWRWVASWARSIRLPSDLGFDNKGFDLPPLHTEIHKVPGKFKGKGFFNWAKTPDEQREEKKNTIQERCQKAAELATGSSSVVWCHFNPEGDLLERIIPNSVQVSGKDSDDEKEEKFDAFKDGQIQTLITKPKIAGFGMNWQHCSNIVCFPSHSYESYYQLVRRFWRFGQINPVTVHIVLSEGEKLVLDNMLKKEKQSVEMYESIVRSMSEFQVNNTSISQHTEPTRLPQWL